MERIRARGHRGHRMDLWTVHSVHGKVRKQDPEYYDRQTYNYKVITPAGELIEGKEYQPNPEWSREEILDNLLKKIGIAVDAIAV